MPKYSKYQIKRDNFYTSPTSSTKNSSLLNSVNPINLSSVNNFDHLILDNQISQISLRKQEKQDFFKYISKHNKDSKGMRNENFFDVDPYDKTQTTNQVNQMNQVNKMGSKSNKMMKSFSSKNIPKSNLLNGDTIEKKKNFYINFPKENDFLFKKKKG